MSAMLVMSQAETDEISVLIRHENIIVSTDPIYGGDLVCSELLPGISWEF